METIRKWFLNATDFFLYSGNGLNSKLWDFLDDLIEQKIRRTLQLFVLQMLET